MTIYIPYFYIIQHISSGKMYAGCRYGKKANPDELLKPDGYQTSSNLVKKLILEDGLDSFRILRIDTYCDNLHVYEYEQLFLKTTKCSTSPKWLNIRDTSSWVNISINEERIRIPDEPKVIENKNQRNEKTKEYFLKNHGVEYGFQVETTKKAIRNSFLARYGVDHNMRSEEGILAYKKAIMEKYGVDNISKLPEIKIKKIESRNKTYDSRPQVFCPHCNLESTPRGLSNMKRYHFDKCKLKKV